MNIISYEFTADEFTLYGELDGFVHNCTVGASVAEGLTLEQVTDLAEFTIREAYDRFVSEV